MARALTLPSHAYVPGSTARHPEGSFDHIRDTVRKGMSVQQLCSSAAFQSGLLYMEKGYFWEAHEVFEPVWMVLPEDSDERRLVQALIQFSNAQLKLKMNRPKAARRLCAIVRGLLSELPVGVVMGLEIDRIAGQLDSFERELGSVK